MNKQSLIQKMAENLGVSRTQKDLAFKIFINKVTSILEYDEALKIPDIGIFQLKKGSDENGNIKETAFNKSSRIIFSPTYSTDKEEKVSLFLTINVDEQNRASEILDEKIFSLGVGKPLIPLADSGRESSGGTADIYFQKSIQARVADLLSRAEKLENFDLWDDYLSRQRLASYEDCQPGTEDNVEGLEFNEPENETADSEENLPDFENNGIHESFEEKVEILDQNLADKKIVEDVLENTNNSEIEDTETDRMEMFPDENEISEKPDVPSESDNFEIPPEESASVLDFSENNIINDSNELSENVINEENSLSETLGNDSSIIENNENLDIGSEREESLKNFEETEGEEKGIIEGENFENNTTSPKLIEPEENDVVNNYSKQAFWMLVIAFVLLGVIGIYYFFISGNNSQPAKIAVKREVVNKPEIKKVNTQEKASLPVAEKIENQPAKPIVKENVTNDNNNKVTASANKPVAGQETEIEDFIYFNGLNYSVQVSSWKKPENAKAEIEKLKRKGINASVVKADLGSRGIWYRVRVKNIKSLKEAHSIKNNLFGKK